EAEAQAQAEARPEEAGQAQARVPAAQGRDEAGVGEREVQPRPPGRAVTPRRLAIPDPHPLLVDERLVVGTLDVRRDPALLAQRQLRAARLVPPVAMHHEAVRQVRLAVALSPFEAPL